MLPLVFTRARPIQRSWNCGLMVCGAYPAMRELRELHAVHHLAGSFPSQDLSRRAGIEGPSVMNTCCSAVVSQDYPAARELRAGFERAGARVGRDGR